MSGLLGTLNKVAAVYSNLACIRADLICEIGKNSGCHTAVGAKKPYRVLIVDLGNEEQVFASGFGYQELHLL
jgi:hypothetical protein